jgi:hypothetical protein
LLSRSEGQARISSFFGRHPIILLLLLSPGIPEYLSSSSPISALLLSPGRFLFQIAANLGLYTPGVLLVREALLRWNKGWASCLSLGAAYGVLEEGITAATMFNPDSPSRSLHGYAWWLGVNWVWSPSITLFHMVYSITLPILLFRLALPEKKDDGLLGGRKIFVAFGVLLADVAAMMAVVYYTEHFVLGLPRFLGSVAVIAILLLVGAEMPSSALSPRSGYPQRRPRAFALMGLAFFPIIALGESIGSDLNVPPWLLVGTMLILEWTLVRAVLRSIGSMNHTRHLLALAAGLLAPLALFGLAAQIALPLVLVVDLLLALFLKSLWMPIGQRGD